MTQENEIEEIAARLQSSFGTLLTSAAGGGEVRPTALVVNLGIDKSLASRITRAVKSPNALASLHLMPTESGLMKIVDAARTSGTPDRILEEAVDAARKYGAFLGTFTGGRADLDAALASWIPELKQEMLQKARREIFRGWATTTGVRAGAFYSAHFILPGTSPGRLNVAVVSTQAEVCRLRSGVPLKIAGFRFAGSSERQIQTLDGGEIQGDPRATMIPELSTIAPEDCSVDQGPDSCNLRILGDKPSINEPVTFTYAFLAPDLLPTTKCDERSYMWTEFVQLLAVPDFFADIFIHKDVRMDAHPIITRVMNGTPQPDFGCDPSVYADAGVEHDLEVRSLSPVATDPSMDEYPAMERMVEIVGAKLGFGAGDLRGYRMGEKYMTPMYRTGLWLELPDPD